MAAPRTSSDSALAALDSTRISWEETYNSIFERSELPDEVRLLTEQTLTLFETLGKLEHALTVGSGGQPVNGSTTRQQLEKSIEELLNNCIRLLRNVQKVVRSFTKLETCPPTDLLGRPRTGRLIGLQRTVDNHEKALDIACSSLDLCGSSRRDDPLRRFEAKVHTLRHHLDSLEREELFERYRRVPLGKHDEQEISRWPERLHNIRIRGFLRSIESIFNFGSQPNRSPNSSDISVGLPPKPNHPLRARSNSESWFQDSPVTCPPQSPSDSDNSSPTSSRRSESTLSSENSQSGDIDNKPALIDTATNSTHRESSHEKSRLPNLSFGPSLEEWPLSMSPNSDYAALVAEIEANLPKLTLSKKPSDGSVGSSRTENISADAQRDSLGAGSITKPTITAAHPSGSVEALSPLSPEIRSRSACPRSLNTLSIIANPRTSIPELDQADSLSVTERSNHRSSVGHSSSDHNKCKKCHEILDEESIRGIGEYRWHPECFRCSTCDWNLTTKWSLLLHPNDTISLRCDLCRSRCATCSCVIQNFAVFVNKSAFSPASSYCATCFKCCECRSVIAGLKYARRRKKFYCMTCHERREAVTRCQIPDFPQSPSFAPFPRPSSSMSGSQA